MSQSQEILAILAHHPCYDLSLRVDSNVESHGCACYDLSLRVDSNVESHGCALAVQCVAPMPAYDHRRAQTQIEIAAKPLA